MAEGIIYPKGIVPRDDDFRAAQKMRGEVYNFLKETMEQTVEEAFKAMGYSQKAAPAGYYGDGNAYGFGVDEGVYNVKVGSKTDSYLEKRIGLGGKRIVCELHMTMYPQTMTVEMHYKNTEDAAFRGFKEGKDGGYMINDKIIMSCANMEKFKTDMKKKLKEFAEKEVGFITMTKLGNEDRMEKSTASVVEGFSLKSLFEDDFETSSNKIQEMAVPNMYEKEEEDDLLLGDTMHEEEEFETHGIYQTSNHGGYEIQLSDDGDGARIRYHEGPVSDWLEVMHDGDNSYVIDPDNGEKLSLSDFMRVQREITSAGGAGSAGGFGYDAPLGAPRKRTMKSSAPFDQTVNESESRKNYKFKVKHDKGTVTLTTPATSEDAARKKIAKAEGCPESALTLVGSSEMNISESNHESRESLKNKLRAVDVEMDAEIEAAKEKARKESENGYVQHVNMGPGGKYIVSDWYDEDSTIASYENGRQLNENKNMKKFNDTPYARRMNENRRPTNHTRIIPEGTDGFWQVVPQSTLDAYKSNHIMGAPGAEGVEVNSKEEEEYNSGGVQKFPGGKSHDRKLDEDYAKKYLEIDASVRKRYKPSRDMSEKELNERWKRLSTMGDSETIREAESVIPDREYTPAPKRNITESEEGLQSLSRDNGLEEGETVDGKLVIEVAKPNCLAPVFYKVFKEDYENPSRAYVWDFNTGNLVNNPGFIAR